MQPGPLYQRHHRPHPGRREREHRHAGRYHYRRAEGDDRLCRVEGDQRHDKSGAAPWVPEVGIPAGARHDRPHIAEKTAQTAFVQYPLSCRSMKEYSQILDYLYGLEKFGMVFGLDNITWLL